MSFVFVTVFISKQCSVGWCMFVYLLHVLFCIQISIFAEDCGGFLLRGHIDWAIGRKSMVYK